MGDTDPLDCSELARLSGLFFVDITLPPAQAVVQLLEDFDHEDFLGRFQIEELLRPERLDKALQTSLEAERSERPLNERARRERRRKEAESLLSSGRSRKRKRKETETAGQKG